MLDSYSHIKTCVALISTGHCALHAYCTHIRIINFVSIQPCNLNELHINTFLLNYNKVLLLFKSNEMPFQFNLT